MIDENVDNGSVIIEYLKERGEVYWDAFVRAVCIHRSNIPTLDVVVNSFNRGASSHLVDVDHLRDYINNHTHNLSIHSVLHFYDIEMLSGRNKLQYIYIRDSDEITPNK